MPTAVIGTAVIGTAIIGTAVIGTAIIGTAIIGTAVIAHWELGKILGIWTYKRFSILLCFSFCVYKFVHIATWLLIG